MLEDIGNAFSSQGRFFRRQVRTDPKELDKLLDLNGVCAEGDHRATSHISQGLAFAINMRSL